MVKVEDGASLVITATTGAGQIYALATNLEVAGPGVGNNGAVQRTGGSASLHGLFKNVTLKGDTTFRAASRWGLAEGGTFDMGGHKLTIIGGDTFEFYSGSITVQNAGEIERTAGSLLIQSNITGSKDKITLDNGTMLTMWGQTLSWPVDIRASTTVRAGSGDARRYNVISGNMTVGTRVTWNPDAAGRCMTLAGGIDCAGNFLKTGPGTLYVTGKVDRVVGAPATDGGLTKRGAYLLDFNMTVSNPNTYEGPTVVEEGTLKFSSRTYSEASPLVLKGGTVAFGGHAYTLKSIEGYGAITGSGGVTVTNELRVSCADIFGANRSIAAQKVTLADGVRLVITDPENLDSYKSAGQVAFLTASMSLSGNAPATALSAEYGAWSCVKVGNSLKFGVPSGTMIMFK